MSVDETLAAIDAAVGCQQCGKPLAGSVSDDFDTEECQAAWHAARASQPDKLSHDGVSVIYYARGLTVFGSGANTTLAALNELLRAHGTAATNDHGHPRSEIATREASNECDRSTDRRSQRG